MTRRRETTATIARTASNSRISRIARGIWPTLILLLLLGALGGGAASAQCVNGTACNDNNACTTNDTCVNEVCVGTAITCADDGNVCTTAICNPVTGCGQTANTAPCDDGNLCTLNDVCSAGACQAGSPRNCSDANVCTADLCTPATGACSNPPNTAACSDGNPCTTGDVCSAGSCQPGTTPLVCSDGNACTSDSCNPAIGCVFGNLPNGTGCSDDSVCTSGDRCASGLCVGSPITCPDDGNACTTATCHPTAGCGQGFNTAPCDDGDLCSVNDFCSGGSCRPGSPKNCGDGNVCTTDVCTSPDGTCSNPANTAACNDGNACTLGDVCTGGTCQPGSTPLACTDGNGCTTDACNPATGCVFPNVLNGTSCSDDSVCTIADACVDGVCNGAPIDCPDDGNGCTTATCNPTSGCGQAFNALPCDDTNGCTLNDVCSGGACVPGSPRDCSDGNVCTTDTCNPRDGTCAYANNSAACSDGNPCTPGDTCVNGTCQPAGPPITCEDGGNVCVVGSCDAVLGCVFDPAPPGTSCNDGNPCTTNDGCSNSVCGGTPIPGCNPAAVPAMSAAGRVGLALALALTALLVSTRASRSDRSSKGV